jgi:hypothetical protein
MITVEYIADGIYVIYFNKKELGSIVSQEDGYYKFTPNKNSSGYWSSYGLRLIADKLDEMNKEWDEHVKKEIDNGK